MTIRPVVLAVDDDPRLLDAYQAILEARYEVLTAPDGRAALEILQTRTVDVVLLDMLLPGLSGLGVLDALRRLGIETNVVVVSAVSDSETALEALRLGASDYLTKPFHVSHLEHTIRRLTEHEASAVAPPPRPSCALPHALIVSADLGLRASLAVALRTRGRVDAVADTGSALAVLARTRPHVVVVSEDAVATAVRGQWPAAPIVVTGAPRPDFDALLRAIVEAFGVRHADVRHFAGPVPRVIAHVSAHFRRTTVEAIAAAVGLSSARLASVFAEQMEMTVTEYMTQVKLEAERPQLAKMLRRHAFSTVASYRAQ
jgi:DNA-binding response OmpR family regulator